MQIQNANIFASTNKNYFKAIISIYLSMIVFILFFFDRLHIYQQEGKFISPKEI